MTHWNTVPKVLGDLFFSWLTSEEVYVAWSICRHWQRVVPAWDVIASSRALHMCNPGRVRQVVLNAFDWKHDVDDWKGIARCQNLRSFDCAVWWNWVGSSNEEELALASEALRDKTIEMLTIGSADNLTPAKESLLRNLPCVTKLCVEVRDDSRGPIRRVLACFPALDSIDFHCPFLGHVSLPPEVGLYRNVCVGHLYDDDFLPSLCGPIYDGEYVSSRYAGRLQDITISEQDNARDLIGFLKTNPQLKRARLALQSTAPEELIQQITTMSNTNFSLIWHEANDIGGLRNAHNIEFLLLHCPEHFDAVDAQVVGSLSNLHYFGLEVFTWNSCPLDALRSLKHLRTFFLEAFTVEPPLHLSWTRHCATLRDVSVVDHDRVWCHSSTPSDLPDVMYAPSESLSYDRQLFPYDELRRYREAQQTAICKM